jgi:hypothetical protein
VRREPQPRSTSRAARPARRRAGRPRAQSVLADVSIATGYATIALMLAGRLVFQYLGWGVAAATTPLVMAVTGGAFFAFSLSGAPETATLGVYAGAVTQARPAGARCLLAAG